MKNKGLWLAGIAVLGLVIFVAVTNASAGKYKDAQRTTFGKTKAEYAVSAEKTTSMNDCMSFCSSFGSKGRKAAKSNLNRQYGAPTSELGRVYTYNYDNYTNILLDCSRGRCYAKCLQK